MNSGKTIKIIIFLLLLSQVTGCTSKNTILQSQKVATSVKKEKVSTNYVKSPDGKHAISASVNEYNVLLYKDINKSEPKSIKLVGLDYKFLWSPNSNKVCISYRGRIWSDFSIIDVNTESELEKPTINSIIKQLKANGTKINYELNENRADPYLTPIEWSLDNKNILIFYQWVDKEFKVQNGVFIFDTETKCFTRIKYIKGDSMFIKIEKMKSMKIYASCYGEGDPTVVFESGLGCTHDDWKAVQNQISKHTRTFSYDRAGLGNSDTGDLPRTSLDQVHELHTVLNKANVKAPYIIVAHSIGGYNARLFAGTYPKEVSGIIFVDCSHENQFEDRVKRSSSIEIETVKSELINEEQTFNGLLVSAKQVKEIRIKDALRNIPIIVLTADHKGEESGAITEEAWLNYQGDLVTLSDYSKHVIVEDCGHYIQKDKPQVVINAIKEIVSGTSK